MTTGKTTRGKKKTGTKGFALLPAKLAAGVAAGAKRKLDELVRRRPGQSPPRRRRRLTAAAAV